MTVSSIIPVNNYTGNSSTKIFDFDFLIESEQELTVQHKDQNGVVSVLQYGIDYSINEIGNKNGSYIEFPLSSSSYGVLQANEQISLALSLQIKQESEFHNSSYFNLDVLEWTFDYIVRILQILNRKIERCVKVEESISISPDEIIEELNEKCEKVYSSYSKIVEISKTIEEDKNTSIKNVNLSDENAKTSKIYAELAKQKAKESGNIIGELISIICDKSYVPENCLPCDGSEYSKEQFKDLWRNYLIDNIIVSELFVVYSGEINNGIYYGGTASVYPTSVSDEVIYCLQLGEDVTTYKDIGIFDLSIRNGGCYATSTHIIDVTANSKLYVKFTFEDNSTNTTYPYKAKYSCSTDNVTYKSVGTMSINRLFANVSNPLPIVLAQSYYNSTPLAETKKLLNTCTYSQYQSDISTYGQCAKFAVDNTNGKFRVPLIKNGAVIQQALSDTELGKAYNAGLPNITGAATGTRMANITTMTGALQITGTSQADNFAQGGGDSNKLNGFDLDASRSSAIYGNSDTVQMNAVALRYFVVVANGQTNQSMMDWSAWASNLQSKMNADHSNDAKPYIVEVSDKSILPSWYRVWSDGWCEQGSYLKTTSTGTVTINLLKGFVNTNYSIQLTESYTATITDARTVNQNNKTTSSFQIFRGTTAVPIYWGAKGYIR